MKTQRIIRYGLRDLGRHRLRTFFMMLGTFVGVLALTLVVAIGQGTRDSVMGNIERMFAGNSILLSAGGGGMMGGPRAGGPPPLWSWRIWRRSCLRFRGSRSTTPWSWPTPEKWYSRGTAEASESWGTQKTMKLFGIGG